MKIITLALGLLCVGAPVWADAPKADAPKLGLRVATQEAPTGQELLSHIFDAYDAAKTYRGLFTLEANVSRDAQPTQSHHYQLRTAWRRNDNGDKEREKTSFYHSLYDGKSTQRQNLLFVDNGLTSAKIWDERKVWLNTGRGGAPVLELLLRSTIEGVASSIIAGVQNNPHASLTVEKQRDGGRQVFVIRSKPDAAFRVVVDAQTRALRFLKISTQGVNLTIRGSEQVFDASIPDTSFEWKASPELREVKQQEELVDLNLFGIQFDANK